VIDRSGKNRLPRVRECRRRRCTEAAFEGSTVAAWAVGEEVETERRDETGRRDESRQGGCSRRRRLYHIADADEERGVGRAASVVVLGDGCRDADVVGLLELLAGLLGIHRCLNGRKLAAMRIRTLERERGKESGGEAMNVLSKPLNKRTRPAAHKSTLSSAQSVLLC
jgi:hypothetical protein